MIPVPNSCVILPQDIQDYIVIVGEIMQDILSGQGMCTRISHSGLHVLWPTKDRA